MSAFITIQWCIHKNNHAYCMDVFEVYLTKVQVFHLDSMIILVGQVVYTG